MPPLVVVLAPSTDSRHSLTMVAKSKSGARAARGVAKVTPLKKKASGGTLLEKDNDILKCIPPLDAGKAQSEKKDSAKIIAKIIYDNFKGFKDSQIHMVRKVGHTLYDRLAKDRVRCTAGEICMGKHYYAHLRSLYREDDDPLAKLSEVDRSEEKDESLCQALAHLGRHCSEPAALLAWLQKEELPNKRCCAALMKMAVLLDPYVGQNRCEVLMAILV